MITSGLVAHVCCVAALIIPPHIIKKHSVLNDSKCDSEHLGNDNEKTTLKTTYFQFKAIFSNDKFILVCLVIGLLLFSSSVGFTHLIAFAESEGLDSHWSTVAVTMTGVGSFGKDKELIFEVKSAHY